MGKNRIICLSDSGNLIHKAPFTRTCLFIRWNEILPFSSRKYFSHLLNRNCIRAIIIIFTFPFKLYVSEITSCFFYLTWWAMYSCVANKIVCFRVQPDMYMFSKSVTSSIWTLTLRHSQCMRVPIKELFSHSGIICCHYCCQAHIGLVQHLPVGLIKNKQPCCEKTLRTIC